MRPVDYRDGRLYLIDQRRLPSELHQLELDHLEAVAEAILTLAVRGAPAIGLAVAYALAMVARQAASAGSVTVEAVQAAGVRLAGTRPTAVNLFWAIERMTRVAVESEGDPLALEREAQAIDRENEEADRRMGELGRTLLPPGARVLTHCNTGALATGGRGSALGVVRAAHEAGQGVRVLADETRPLLQGARLTAWELREWGIPVTLITDNMAAHFMARGEVDLCLVGADRIARNGDVANKIGTYGVAVLAKEHGIPFYVAAPLSTFDARLSSGVEIPIEERSPAEVSGFGGFQTAPEGVAVANPAFDVTPHRLVTAIITPAGILHPPYAVRISEILDRQEAV